MEITQKPHTHDLFDVVAMQLISVASSAVREKGFAVVGVVGGRSIRGVYEALVDKKFDASNIHFFMLDERRVPITSSDSNYKVLHDVLGEMIPAPNLHPFDYLTDSVTSYAQRLEMYGGAFDVVILGAGEDGHVASLFPNHSSIKDPSTSFIEVSDSPKPPKERISVSKSLLSQSSSAAVLFLGEGKRAAYQAFLKEGTSIEDCPVKLVSEIPDCRVYTDIFD